MKKLKSRKYTICAPDILSVKLDAAYDALTNIDCNFSRLLHCILSSIINVAAFIAKQKKNFRHYHWHLIIQDRETGQYYSSSEMKGIRK